MRRKKAIKKIAIKKEQIDALDVNKKVILYGIQGNSGDIIYDIINKKVAPGIIISLAELKDKKSLARKNFIELIYKTLKEHFGEEFQSKKQKIDQVINNYFISLIQIMERGGFKPAGASIDYKKYIIRKAHLTLKDKKNIIPL